MPKPNEHLPTSAGPTPAPSGPTESPFCRLTALSHNLAPHYAALRTIRNRKALEASTLFSEIEAELSFVLSGIETGEHASPANRQLSDGTLRVVAWNIQRGREFSQILDALKNDETLSRADVVLLSEVDVGMGRSHNRNVPRELAAALGFHYAFGVSYLVLGDDVKENEEGTENTLALAGQAMLSRLPIEQVVNVDLPELKDKFSSKREKRLGKKRALMACVGGLDKPLWVSTCHLDSNASPAQRSEQLRALLEQIAKQGSRVLVGGDFNTTTYDASSKAALFRDLLHKFFHKGFDRTVAGYMTPQTSYEQPVFALLEELGFATEGLNDLHTGSYFYDVESPFAEAKLIEKVGTFLTRRLQKRLRPWNGRVPARLDWFVGKNVRGQAAGVVEVAPRNGIPASDHLPIYVDIGLPKDFGGAGNLDVPGQPVR